MRKKPMLTLLSTAVITAVAALSVPTTVVIAAPAKAAAAGKFTNKAYIVRLAEKPVVAYDGGIKGLKATRPGKGQKIDPNSPEVVATRSFLERGTMPRSPASAAARSSTATGTRSTASRPN